MFSEVCVRMCTIVTTVNRVSVHYCVSVCVCVKLLDFSGVFHSCQRSRLTSRAISHQCHKARQQTPPTSLLSHDNHSRDPDLGERAGPRSKQIRVALETTKPKNQPFPCNPVSLI